MHVKLREWNGGHAATPHDGEALLGLIAPALERGEPVVLDFEGTLRPSAPFLVYSIGRLVEQDTQGRILPLISHAHLPEYCEGLWQSVIDGAVRRREIPGWAEATYAAAAKRAERD